MFTKGDYSTAIFQKSYTCEKCGQTHSGIHACPAQESSAVSWSAPPAATSDMSIRIPTYSELSRLFERVEQLERRVAELEAKQGDG